MNSWLVSTGLVEIANIVIFALLAKILVAERSEPSYLTWVGVATLGVLLFEGGLYWIVKRWRFGHGLAARIRLRLLRALYAANALVLLVFPLVTAIGLLGPMIVSLPDLLLGFAYYLFACGEFVHYFLVKINMRPAEWRHARDKGRCVQARFRRELARASAEVARIKAPPTRGSESRNSGSS
jgi:hypothetical protein